MKILLAEDDTFLADGLSLVLTNNGYQIERAKTGLEADAAMAANNFDLLILDLGLPEIDGLEVLQRVRSRGQSTPILILTARDSLDDRVSGLDMGANDYLTKPFDLPELEARVRALLRKDKWSNMTTIAHGNLRFDTGGRRAEVNGEALDLSARELAVLELLLTRAGRIVNKDQISDRLAQWDGDVTYNAIEIIVHRLRKKLEDSGCKIRTIRGLGYVMDKSQG